VGVAGGEARCAGWDARYGGIWLRYFRPGYSLERGSWDEGRRLRRGDGSEPGGGGEKEHINDIPCGEDGGEGTIVISH